MTRRGVGRDAAEVPERAGMLAAGALVAAGLAALVIGRRERSELSDPPTEEPGEGADVHLPSPSVWPAVLGLGVTLLLFGVVTSVIVSLAGALLIVGALGGWIGELRREGRHEPGESAAVSHLAEPGS